MSDAPERIFVTIPPESSEVIPGVEWAAKLGQFPEGFEGHYVDADMYQHSLMLATEFRERVASLEAERAEQDRIIERLRKQCAALQTRTDGRERTDTEDSP